MDAHFQQEFLIKWQDYFPNAELPIAYYYADTVSEQELGESRHSTRCLIGNLKHVRAGSALVYSADSPGCLGGRRYTGFTQSLRPNFEYFLSYGIPGEMEGERYKQSPELVQEYLKSHPPFQAPGKYLVFKRWDRLADGDQPAAVIFFATPDVLSGLFTLANYDYAGPHGVIAPMGAGCASIVNYPLEEAQSEKPRCVLGMFDVSARPYVPAGCLTFTIPMKRLAAMAAFMDESFLITDSWRTVKNRLAGS